MSYYLDLGLELLRQPHSRLTLITRAELPMLIVIAPQPVQFSLMLIYGVR